MRKSAIIFSLLISQCVFAQKEADRTIPPAPQFSITTIPIRCLLRDYNIGVSWRANFTHTVELRVGYVHGNKILHDRFYEGWLTSTEMLFHGTSLYAQANKWKMNVRGKRIYTGLIFGYRYLWFTDKRMAIHDGDGYSDDEDLTLSQWRNDLLLLITKGWQTSKVTTFEISVGLRLMYTHTNVTDTKFHFDPYGSETYENYKRSLAGNLLFSEGFGILPLIRFSSRLGKFAW